MKQRELFDIAVSWFSISLAFAFIYSGGFFQVIGVEKVPFFSAFVLSAFAVGTGFVLHELAHRFVAKKFGLHAEYRMWVFGLVFAIALALFTPFIFAAPGAVYIFGKDVSRKKNGLISLAGPATNIGLGIIFLVFGTLVLGAAISGALFFAASVNFFLALFNLIPFGPLDGSKVFEWNPLVWAVFFVPMLLVFLL